MVDALLVVMVPLVVCAEEGKDVEPVRCLEVLDLVEELRLLELERWLEQTEPLDRLEQLVAVRARQVVALLLDVARRGAGPAAGRRGSGVDAGTRQGRLCRPVRDAVAGVRVVIPVVDHSVGPVFGCPDKQSLVRVREGSRDACNSLAWPAKRGTVHEAG